MSNTTKPDGADPHKFDECPSCEGELQYQTESDAQCLNCGEVFTHEIRGDRHLLWDFDGAGRIDGGVARACV